MLTKLSAATMATIVSSTKLEDPSTTAQITSIIDTETNMTPARDWMSEMLAQTEQARPPKPVAHDCQHAYNRLRAGPDQNFYKIQEGIGVWGLYRDYTYRGREVILWDDNPHSEGTYHDRFMKQAYLASMKSITLLSWQRKIEGLSLFGDHGIQPNDIFQGQIGNCGIVAAAASMAEVPERVESIFVNYEEQSFDQGLSKRGIYALNLYALMMPIVVTIDDMIPFIGHNPVYAKIGKDGSVWTPLLEKAMAKYHGSYEALDAADLTYQALHTIAGAPHQEFYHQGLSTAELWNELIALPDSAMVTCDTLHRQNTQGIHGMHGYTVLRPIQKGNGPRLLEIRNPMGKSEWTGDYSDYSDLWTPELKEAYGFDQVKNEGIFFMSLDDYHQLFRATFVNHDPSTLHRTDWLILDDHTDSPPSTTALDYWKCPRCTQHEFILFSFVNQKVILSANTWEGKDLPNECDIKVNNGKNHKIEIEGRDELTWESGTLMSPPFEMKRWEQTKIWITMDYEGRQAPRDVSVVAWGFDGPVFLWHTGGIRSMSFPGLPDDEN